MTCNLKHSWWLITQSQCVVMIIEPVHVHVLSFSPQEWQINRLSYEYDSEPFGKERDAAIQKLACEAGVEVMVRTSHTLYDLSR